MHESSWSNPLAPPAIQIYARVTIYWTECPIDGTLLVKVVQIHQYFPITCHGTTVLRASYHFKDVNLVVPLSLDGSALTAAPTLVEPEGGFDTAGIHQSSANFKVSKSLHRAGTDCGSGDVRVPWWATSQWPRDPPRKQMELTT